MPSAILWCRSIDKQTKNNNNRSSLLTWFNLLDVIANVSSVVRRYCKLLSFNMVSCVLENFKLRIWMPFTNISDDMDVVERSKSYSDSIWMGDLTIWSVERRIVDVVRGHSSWRPILWFFLKEERAGEIRMRRKRFSKYDFC